MKKIIITTILAILSSLSYALEECSIVTVSTDDISQFMSKKSMDFDNAEIMCHVLKENNAAVYIQAMTQVSDTQSTAFTVIHLFPYDHKIAEQEPKPNSLTSSNYMFSSYIENNKGENEEELLHAVILGGLQKLTEEQDLFFKMLDQVELMR